jgi:hypothetical protein
VVASSAPEHAARPSEAARTRDTAIFFIWENPLAKLIENLTGTMHECKYDCGLLL